MISTLQPHPLQPQTLDLVLESYRHECELVLDSLDIAVERWWNGSLGARAEALGLVGWLIDMSIAVRHCRTSEMTSSLHEYLSCVDATERFDPSATDSAGDEMLVLETIAGLRRLLAGGRCRPDLVDRLEEATTIVVRVSVHELVAAGV